MRGQTAEDEDSLSLEKAAGQDGEITVILYEAAEIHGPLRVNRYGARGCAARIMGSGSLYHSAVDRG